MNYYNDHEPFVAQWLKRLITAGLLPPGDVDSRPIQEVTKNDVRGYTQCHFFAGIGGWPLALQYAGWPTTRPVWTGSCPCQPFSVAGKGKGEDDPRHLWPELKRLIAERKTPVVFGEQVASKDGRQWLAGVRSDLETLGYAVGGGDLCAASIGAPHIRQRLFWVADSEGAECDWIMGGEKPECIGRRRGTAGYPQGESGKAITETETTGSMPNGGLGHTDSPGCGELCGAEPMATEQLAVKRAGDFWSNYTLIPCRDGKTRRIKPGLAPLVARIPGDVGIIRAAGNSISPQIAAEFIMAFMEVRTHALGKKG